jgi:hypothetical protein
VVSFTPWLLYPRERDPSTHWIKRLGGPQSQSGHSGEEEKIPSLPLLGIKPLLTTSIIYLHDIFLLTRGLYYSRSLAMTKTMIFMA